MHTASALVMLKVLRLENGVQDFKIGVALEATDCICQQTLPMLVAIISLHTCDQMLHLRIYLVIALMPLLGPGSADAWFISGSARQRQFPENAVLPLVHSGLCESMWNKPVGPV